MGIYKKVTDASGKTSVVKQAPLRKRVPMADYAKLEAERDTFRDEVNRLSDFITNNFPGEIRGTETAVDVAIRLLESKGQRLDTSDHR